MLVPKSLDPVSRGRRMPVPDPRPSQKIAKLFPQVDPLKDQQRDPKIGVKPPDISAVPPPKNATGATEPAKSATPPQSAATAQAIAGKVPLPEARPIIRPGREGRRHRRLIQYRLNR
jgi:membrane-bound lytic murein transglycosylase A